MYTSITLAALAGFLVAPNPPITPQWHLDYGAARAVGKQLQKPLAVVVGTGQDGYRKLTGNGHLAPAVSKLLQDHYVCVYADATTPKGQRLAAALEITNRTGIVLSNRTGALQAFAHNGTISDDLLVDYLRRYANPQAVVSTTETVQTQQVSYYPPAQPATAPAAGSAPTTYQPAMNAPFQYQPSFYQPSMSGFSGGGFRSGGC